MFRVVNSFTISVLVFEKRQGNLILYRIFVIVQTCEF